MKIINFNNFDLSKINRLVKLHLGNIKLNKGYVYVNKNMDVLGYCLLKDKGKTIKIDWIYAKKGYGTDFIKKVERALFKKYSKIILHVSIDPNEQKKTVIRRINFYIKNNYRVSNIKYRKKYGPELTMFKNK